MNVNTASYWNRRFETGDWEQRDGRKQTREFAIEQIRHFEIPPTFAGTILDFGCGLGDALPVYRNAWPRATLVAVDISSIAIEKCNAVYGGMAQFIVGDHTAVPAVDVIIASNVVEHLTEDVAVVSLLLRKCKKLYVVTPYAECLVPGGEHVNSYQIDHFKELGTYRTEVYRSKVWGAKKPLQNAIVRPIRNVVRRVQNRPPLESGRQIIFSFDSNSEAQDQVSFASAPTL